MSRVFGRDGDGQAARIDPTSVADFFAGRAARIDELGPTRAVIYQDKHPDLAERRDAAERDALLPKLQLDGTQRLLDLGCGTGRWVNSVAGLVSAYHGIDLTPGLIDFARAEYGTMRNVRFSVGSVDDFSLQGIAESQGFDRVLAAGVLIYLNDDQLERALTCMRRSLSGEAPRLVLREPVAQDQRLTIVEHYSEDLDAVYNAVYRTRDELVRAISSSFTPHGLEVVDHGYLFADDSLNNRHETRQEWFVVGPAT